MAFPALPLGILAGGTLLGNLSSKFRGQTEFNLPNPADFKDQLTLSDSDIAGITSSLFSNLGMLNSANVAGIKQVGATGGLPSGAVADAIAGSSAKLGEGAARIAPQLSQAKVNSFQDYFRLLNNYAGQKMAFDQGNANAVAGFNQQGLGNIGKILTLWQGGFFNQPQFQGA